LFGAGLFGAVFDAAILPCLTVSALGADTAGGVSPATL